MKGWLIFPIDGVGLFSFKQDEHNNLLLYYTDDNQYPSIYIEKGQIIANYSTWYPNIQIDNNFNILTDNPNISLDEDYNIIYTFDENVPISKMFFIDDDGNLIYEYDSNPLDLIKDADGNIWLNIK